jgi:hypothetical protein
MEESPQQVPAQQQSIDAQESNFGNLDESIRDALQALSQLLNQQIGAAGAGEAPSSEITHAEGTQEREQKNSAHRPTVETSEGGYIVADHTNERPTFTIQSVTGETVEISAEKPVDLVDLTAAITQGVLQGVARAKEARVQAAGGDVSAAFAGFEWSVPITYGIIGPNIGVQFGQPLENATMSSLQAGEPPSQAS